MWRTYGDFCHLFAILPVETTATIAVQYLFDMNGAKLVSIRKKIFLA